MAFYQDAPKKGRVKKEFGNSSWEEEGTRYTKEDRTADGGAFSSASGKKQKPGTGCPGARQGRKGKRARTTG